MTEMSGLGSHTLFIVKLVICFYYIIAQTNDIKPSSTKSDCVSKQN